MSTGKCFLRTAGPVLAALLLGQAHGQAADRHAEFFAAHCYTCHDSDSRKGNLDLTALRFEFTNAEAFSQWVKVHDRIAAGEMPPNKKHRPPADDVAAVTQWLRHSLSSADKARFASQPKTVLRRLTRSEYENTMRDLFEMPGLALQGGLPADGSAFGFDKNSEALDISHVNMAKYVEAADQVLDLAIATQPKAPTVHKQRVSLAKHVGHILGNGDAVLLKDMKPDPDYPPAGENGHLNEGYHERIGLFARGSSVGIFRHEDESFNPYFQEFTTLYPGLYRLRASFWSLKWDKGQVLPNRGVEAARLSAVQLTEDGRGGGHPSYVLGYYDAPSLQPTVHEFTTWLNYKETIGFNTASLAPTANYSRKGRAMSFMGPGIVSDWLDVEGPVHDVWPPRAHRLLFGALPLVEFKPGEHPGIRPPPRQLVRQTVVHARNRPDPASGIWTVMPENSLGEADRLLSRFLPRAFRRPVEAAVRQQYVERVAERLKEGDCFELAMRWAYRAALCSPDFLFHIEPRGQLDDYALACRLSYLLWNSQPDDALNRLAAAGKLHEPKVLLSEFQRLWKDKKSQRFVEDFTGQWLRLRQISANDPDRKLYPEFSPYLQDSMVAETRAYFRELIERNLDATHLVRSDFAMLNEKLATHYGIAGVSGSQIRRVDLPAECPRGGFLTQAAILKITANGTTTSPVPRGAFVMARLLGRPPEPPPPNIPAVEPDVRGASTIREQLDKHRNNTVCASCHAKIDPPGFALESFDVIGGWRDRYRSIGQGDPAPRGSIDPFIGISFKLGPPVDPSGQLPDGRTFKNIREFQALLAAHPEQILNNLANQFVIYSIGRDITFSDRDQIAAIVRQTQSAGGGIRTLLETLIQSELFRFK